jgi:two-component system NarL family sensor kinase
VHLELPTAMERLPPDHELSLFRIAQEALTNIHRHAASPWAALRLTVQPSSVTLEIEDGGRGMPPAYAHAVVAPPQIGVGLAGMRERIRQLGGIFSVESTGDGTRVRTTIAT